MAEGLENCTEEGDGDLQIASQDFKKLEETQLKVPASIHAHYSPLWLAKCKTYGEFCRLVLWRGRLLGRTSVFKLVSTRGLPEEWSPPCAGECSREK